MKNIFGKDASSYRNLTDKEVEELLRQHCRCDDWSRVKVAHDFTTQYVINDVFCGDVYLGVMGEEIELNSGFKAHCGIYNAVIQNCSIGDNVYIDQIRCYMANYIVDDGAVIENVDFIYMKGDSTFGNGVVVSVMCETGGRDVKICDGMSAQLAYVYTMYRDRSQTISILDSMIDDYSESVRSQYGYIGKKARILSTQLVKNAKIMPYCNVECASRIENATIHSCEEAPTYIGMGVIVHDSIVDTDCRIFDKAIVYNSFIGQGCEIGEQFSAEQSLFFANCIGLHGEACAVFAGPFTVTHHKNTLLIAGMFSFTNAGSGTNQSNHMYKLGPVHQGIIERGTKTASDSYIKWPAKVGPFTVVMGRHYHNSDTSRFPFSYLIEKNDESHLVPGVNLRSVGTVRDAQKWPKRDKRAPNHKTDCINYNLLSPFTIDRAISGRNILLQLQRMCGPTSNNYYYNSTIIKSKALEDGLMFYELAISKFLGNSIISRLENRDCSTDEKMVESLKPDTPVGSGEWLDIAGLIAPKDEILRVLRMIDSKDLDTIGKINDEFASIHKMYYTYEWTWALEVLEDCMKKKYTEFTRKDVKDIIQQWRKSVLDLDQRLLADATKEFSDNVKIGFGADGTQIDIDNDFRNVRGEYDSNSFVLTVKEHIEKKSALAEKMLTKLR